MTIPLDRKTLFAYGLPGLPLAVIGLPLYVYLPVFYVESRGLSLTAVGVVLLLARVFDMLTDPLVGIASDRFVFFHARRKPWIAAATPLLLLATCMLFMPPEAAGAGWLLAWSLVLSLAWTMVALPYAALGAELSTNYHERSRLAGAREGAVMTGTLLAVGAAAMAEHQGLDRGGALEIIALAMILLVPGAVLVLLIVVREFPLRLPAVGFVAGLRVLQDNVSFRRLLVAYLLNGIANGLPATLFLFYVAHVLELARWSGLFLGLYFASGVFALPAWLALARRVGKLSAWRISMGFCALVFLAVPALGAGDLVAFAVISILTGAGLGADQALPASMQADVVDEDTAAGGGERAGLFFGFWSMATKLALALAVGIAFPALAALGFDAGSGDGAAVIPWLYAVLPVAFKLLAIASVSIFSLDQQRLHTLREQIEWRAQGASS